MKIEVASSSSSYTDNDQKNLSHLLDVFGSVVSLEDIASAYCQADRSFCATVELLCNKQASASESSTSKSEEALESTTSASSSVCQSDDNFEDARIPRCKPKKSSASIGTVSGLIGKEYVSHRPRPNGSSETYKPVKLNSDEFPASEIWDEKKETELTPRGESMSSDIEEFLYKMLGNGFQLEMNAIKDVVGQCGYDMQRSIDKLLDLSAATLEKSDGVIGEAASSNMKSNIGLESMSCRGQSPSIDLSGRSEIEINKRNELVEPRAVNKKKDIQREVLESLFSVPERVEEKQAYIAPVRPLRQQSQYGRVVAEPLKETIIEDFTFINRQPVNGKNNEADEDSYEDLREAVMEYWATMKEYYKAAVDAFTEKDNERAQKLMEQGNFFKQKARKADEKSAQKLYQNSDEEEVISINVHYLDPRDALHHFKLNMTSFCCLPSVRYLKVAVGTDGTDPKDGRRKRLITKLLEKESIPWTEEGNGWIISIKVDEVDPMKLNLASK